MDSSLITKRAYAGIVTNFSDNALDMEQLPRWVHCCDQYTKLISLFTELQLPSSIAERIQHNINVLTTSLHSILHTTRKQTKNRNQLA